MSSSTKAIEIMHNDGQCDLGAFDLLSVEGPDSRKFLQGQLTCDMNKLTPTRSLRGAYCNLKGRVICDFRVFLRNDVIYLRTEAGSGQVLKQILDKYIVFSKAKTALHNDVRRRGIIGSACEIPIPGEASLVLKAEDDACSEGAFTVIRAEGIGPRYEIFQFDGVATEPSADAATTARQWQLADIRAGVIHISPALQEMYTPQVLNYDLQGLVDFKKGCYTGQEIVARMHYRGTAKRRVYRVAVPGSLPVTLNLQDAQEDTSCEILCSAQTSGSEGAEGLVELLAILPCQIESGVIKLSATVAGGLITDARIQPFERQDMSP